MLLSDFTVSELVTLARGRWLVPPRRPHNLLAGLSTDTRTLEPGEAFLALRGPRFDGHEFLAEAVRRDAEALVIDDPAALGDPAKFERDHGLRLPAVMVVEDALTAYGDTAHALRMAAGRHGVHIAGIAGSSGKTTTKELLADMLAAENGPASVLRSPANNNNLIGVPKTICSLRRVHRRAAIEAGMNLPGELRRLAEIVAADTVILTNIGSAHAGRFPTPLAHFQAKIDWIEHAAPGATILINSNCPKSMQAARMFAERRRIIYVGTGVDESVCRAINVEPLQPIGYRFDLELFGRRLSARLPLFGRYNIDNVVMAAAAASIMEASDHSIVAALGAIKPVTLRGEILELAGRRIIVDCYNAAPEAMDQALRSLREMARLTGGRGFALLGEMGELGDFAPEAHRAAGRRVAELGLQGLYTVGDLMLYAANEARQLGVENITHLDDLPVLASTIIEDTRAGDVILIKGSRLLKLERIVPMLTDYVGREATPIPLPAAG